MRVIIAGSREIKNPYEEVCTAVKASRLPMGVVISGGARGIDQAGERYAGALGIPCEVFKADWSKGRLAGFARNGEMAQTADALIAVWDGTSKGTWDMIVRMCKKGGPIYIHKVAQ